MPRRIYRRRNPLAVHSAMDNIDANTALQINHATGTALLPCTLPDTLLERSGYKLMKQS